MIDPKECLRCPCCHFSDCVLYSHTLHQLFVVSRSRLFPRTIPSSFKSRAVSRISLAVSRAAACAHNIAYILLTHVKCSTLMKNLPCFCYSININVGPELLLFWQCSLLTVQFVQGSFVQALFYLDKHFSFCMYFVLFSVISIICI